MLREKTNLREKTGKEDWRPRSHQEKNGKEDWRPGQTPQKFVREVVFFLPCFFRKVPKSKSTTSPQKTQHKKWTTSHKKNTTKNTKKTQCFGLRSTTSQSKISQPRSGKKNKKNTYLIIYCKSTIFKTKKHTQKMHNFPPKKNTTQKTQKNTTFRLKDYNFPQKSTTKNTTKNTTFRLKKHNRPQENAQKNHLGLRSTTSQPKIAQARALQIGLLP